MVEVLTPEQDIRLNILNTLLTTPHRKLDEMYPIHTKMISDDPRFYMQLGAWYGDNGEVRDHNEVFIIQMCLSSFEGHREVGLALLNQLPPYQVLNVCEFIFAKEIKDKTAIRKANPPTKRVVRGRGRPVAKAAAPAVPTIKCLHKPLPRSMKTAIQQYLREREADNAKLDSCILTARKAMKRLYVLSGTKPCERAQAILFDDKPPEDSSAAMLKKLAHSTDPVEQAKIISTSKIPYRISSTVVKAMTAPVLAALIDVMTPQELINNIKSLTKRGAMDNPDLKKLISEKLDTAKTSKRVAALKSQEAIKVSNVSDDIKEKLEAVADSQIKMKGRIKRPTAIFVDKSGSMKEAIELGKRIGSLLSTVMDAPLYVYAHDTMPMPITCPKDTDLASWEKAFSGIKANGWTSMGCPVQALLSKKQYVEQIILVTDEGENTAPYFFDMLKKYSAAMNVEPNIFIVKTTSAATSRTGTLLEDQGRTKGITVDAWQFTGDYYALPNLIKFLTKPSKFDLLMEIMSYPLPTRKIA